MYGFFLPFFPTKKAFTLRVTCLSVARRSILGYVGNECPGVFIYRDDRRCRHPEPLRCFALKKHCKFRNGGHKATYTSAIVECIHK